MIKDISFGIIPIRRVHHELQCFLVKHRNGQYWGFPKGHANANESEKECAARELLEETNLEILEWLDGPNFEEKYQFMHQGKHYQKTVVYYLAYVTKEANIDKQEVIDGRWVPIEKVVEHLTFDGAKAIFTKALTVLQQ
jgi:8-oxo-dGTP pyrophosphatase MutT (NUDIX family)